MEIPHALWLTKLKNDLKAIHNVLSQVCRSGDAVADQVKERFESDSQQNYILYVTNNRCG